MWDSALAGSGLAAQHEAGLSGKHPAPVNSFLRESFAMERIRSGQNDVDRRFNVRAIASMGSDRFPVVFGVGGPRQSDAAAVGRAAMAALGV